MTLSKDPRCAAMVLVLMLVAGVAVGQPGDQPRADDPVVRDVVDMLHAGVAPGEVMDWLEAGPHRPAAIDDADLAALTAAGAPDRLVDLLNTLAQEGSAELPTMPPGLPTTSGPAVGGPLPPPPPATPTPAPDAAAVGPGSAAPHGLEPTLLPMHLLVHYRPENAGELPGWDLLAYVDGSFAARVPAARAPLVPQGADTEVSLAPGHHVLRLLVERHVLGDDGTTWSNYARVCPVAVFLELEPDDAGTLEVWVGKPEAGTVLAGGDLRWELRRGGAAVAEHAAVTGAPASWPQLCEDAATRAVAGSGAAAMPQGCLHWSELWPGVAEVPDRATVRQLLADNLYRPRQPAP